MFRFLIVSIVSLTVSACASKSTFTPIDQLKMQGASSITLVEIPVENELYVEISNGPRRYADVELNVGKKFLGEMVGSALGYWAGYSMAMSGVQTYGAAAFNPWVAAAVIVTGPVISSSVELLKQSSARKKAAVFNGMVSRADGRDILLNKLKESLSARDPLITRAIKTARIPEGSDFDAKEYFQQFDTDLVLVTGSLAAFTPEFEVLEINTVYAVFLPGTDEPIYRNSVIVQSKVHGGLISVDTTNEIKDYMDAWLAKKNQVLESRSGSEYELSKYRKHARRKVSMRTKQYSGWDQHDPDGDVWKSGDGAVLRETLSHLYEETSRLIFSDLTKGEILSGIEAVPPGSRKRLARVPKMDTEDRQIYRQADGSLLSLDIYSRLIPLSKE